MYGSLTYQFLLFQKEVVILSNNLDWVLLQNTISLRRFRLAGNFFHSFFLYPACWWVKTKRSDGYKKPSDLDKHWKNPSHLASDPKTAMQPHEPLSHWFDTLSFALFHAEVSETSAWLQHQTWNKRCHTATTKKETSFTFNSKNLNHQTWSKSLHSYTFLIIQMSPI